MKKAFVVICITAIGLISGCSIFQGSTSAPMALAQCLTKKGAIFYGTERCGHCQNQKALFGAAVTGLNYIDCDTNADQCNQAGIDGYPTWVFADGTRGNGTQTLEELASKTGCPYEAQTNTGS